MTKQIERNLIADTEFQRPFDDEEYQSRIDRTREWMAREDVDLLYVTSPEGMCYYTGYQATWYRSHSSTRWPALAALVIHADHQDPIFYDTIGEYLVHRATAKLELCHWIPEDDFRNADDGVNYIVKDLKGRGWASGRVAMEMWSYVPGPALSGKLQDAFRKENVEVVDGTHIVRGARKIKSLQELHYISLAAEVADIGHAAIREHAQPGIPPLELHGYAVQAMMAAGGELPGINQGVISGPHASAHGLSSRHPIKAGEAFAVDLGGVVHRYHANVCRTYVCGEPTPATVRANEVSKAGVKLLCSEARANRPVSEVARILREYYESAGVWEHRGWVGGYELGIAFPPDWVGEWLFNVAAEDEPGVFEANTVTNYESVFAKPAKSKDLGEGVGLGANIDTIIYGEESTRSLSKVDMEPLVCVG